MWCYYCGRVLVRNYPKDQRMTWDHKIPKARGGTNEQKNLVAACFRCNQEKGVLTETEFKAVLSFRRGQQPKANAAFEKLFNPEVTLEDLKFLYEIGVEAL